MSASSEGGIPPIYQWRRGGTDIPGATADTLFFPSMAAGDFGTYTCVVTTPNGSVESNTVTLRLDSEGDGLPDDWEVTNFGDLTKTGPQDSDGDGTSNEHELADGTNPNNPTEARVALTLLRLPGGTVTADPPDARPMKGSTVTLTATATEGLFRSWTGSSTATTPTVTLTMDGDKEIGAIFDEVIVWGAGPFGTLELPPAGLRGSKRLSMGLNSVAFTDSDQAVGWPSAMPPAVKGTSGSTVILDRGGRVVSSSILPVPTNVGALHKAAAASHVVALRKDGTVVCWGATGGGRCAVPAGLSQIVDVAASEEGSLAVRADGTVVVWGTFVPVPPAGLDNVRAITAGRYHAVALKRDGSVVIWGLNGNYDKGQYVNQPADLTNVVAISASGYHSMALKSDGSIVAWGTNAAGESNIPPVLTKAIAIATRSTGSGAIYASPDSTLEPLICTDTSAMASVGYPFKFEILAKGSPTDYFARGLPPGLELDVSTGVISGKPTQPGTFRVVLGASNTHGTGIEQLELIVLPWNSLYSWNKIPASLVPPGITEVASFDAGYGFSIATMKDGTVRVWGTSDTTLQPPTGLTGVVAVAAGNNFALALKENGTVTGWGSSSLVGKIPPDLHDIIAIDCGFNHALALRATGAVVGWGTATMANSPTGGIKQIVSGENYASALRWDGQVHVWGGIFDIPAPPPTGLTGVAKLACSDTHTLALKEDGSVVAWGTNTKGQLNVPVGLIDAVDISAGNAYSVALRSNGSVVIWGNAAEVPMSSDAPLGVALSGMDKFVLMLTQTEPSVLVPHLAMPRYLLVPAGYAFSTRVVAQNQPGAFNASGLPSGLGINSTTGVISGTAILPGVYPVTLSATNGSGTGTHSLTLIVPGGNTFATWGAAYGITLANVAQDPDKDGLSNLEEYALRLNPNVHDSSGAVVGPKLPGVEAAWGGLSFIRPTGVNDVDYEVQASSDLLTWTTVAMAKSGAPLVDVLDSGLATEVLLSPLSSNIVVRDLRDATATKRFMRLRFTLSGTEPATGQAAEVELRAEDFVSGTAWKNRGNLGGAFATSGNPLREGFRGGYGVKLSGNESFSGPALPASFLGGTAHTVEVWAWNGNANANETMVSLIGAPADQHITFGYGTNGLRGAIDQRDTPKFGWDASFTADAPGGVVPVEGKWHHLAYVYESNTLKLYQDGILHRSVAMGMALYTGTIRLGSRYGNDPFVGYLGRIRVHDRALTPEEIMDAHNNERSVYPAILPGAALSAPPSHRYNFTLPEGVIASETIVPDLAGSSGLTVKGTGATSSAGQLDLPGGSSTTSAYVDIPNGLVSASEDVTLEFWYSADLISTAVRFFDFGTGSSGEVFSPGGTPQGTDYIAYAILPQNDGRNILQRLKNDQADTKFIYGNRFNQPVHLVVSYNSMTKQWQCYLNSILVETIDSNRGPQTITDVNNWIGRSSFHYDPNFDGRIDEFRIYPRALTPSEIRGNFSRGPDEIQLSP